MKTYLGYLNQMSRETEERFQHIGQPINWYHPYKSQKFEVQREELLSELDGEIEWSFKGTKPYLNQLSKGCELCGAGEWSCLFITGECNANCFYCPARQDSDEIPQTQKLLFEKPDQYVAYINKFNFKGVSFSGGEPLLVFDRTLEFIRQVRQHCDPELYIWMYTNGILASEEKLKLLGEAGLNEIRFDIGAVNYQPKVLKNASKFIKNVTVEIPAVPEHKQQLLKVLPQLCEYGVTNLNLHQLRLTSYNAPKILQNEYTFLHGEQPVTANSEITAFEIMKFVSDQKLPIGVNYCNFQFKHRFQKAGFRRKMAEVLKFEGEETTQNGYLRRIEIIESGSQRIINLETLGQELDRLEEVKITYSGRVLENVPDSGLTKTYSFAGHDYFVREGVVAFPIVLKGQAILQYLAMMEDNGNAIPDHPLLFEAWKYEFIEEGMREYF